MYINPKISGLDVLKVSNNVDYLKKEPDESE